MGTVWARSSMVEQWPFKPLVKGSSPFALTFSLKELVKGTLKGGIFEPLRAHFYFKPLVKGTLKGVIFEPLRAHFLFSLSLKWGRDFCTPRSLRSDRSPKGQGWGGVDRQARSFFFLNGPFRIFY
jgi:hypothetical protein